MAGSVRAVEKPFGNDLRLDFGGAFKNVEDAGVAKDARDRIFERKAIAAVDLHGVVGARPGDARGEQLGHASFEIAAAALVLGAGGEIADKDGYPHLPITAPGRMRFTCQ